jgi:hypothetical protein
MTGREQEPPRRWTDGGADDSLGRRAGDLLRVPPPAPLGAAARARIGMRLAASRALPRWPRVARYALSVALVAAVAAVAAAAAVSVFRGREATSRVLEPPKRGPTTAVVESRSEAPLGMHLAAEAAPASAVAPVPERRRDVTTARRRTKVAAAAPPREKPATPAPPLEIPGLPAAPASPPAASPPAALPPPALAPSAPSSASTSKPAPASASASAPPASAVAAPPLSEPRLVAAALARLRVDNDATGALALLAEHRRRFPDGALAPEAKMAEVEALLALHRRGEALRTLDGLALGRMSRGDALAVLRAELRAGAGRCGEAIADFDRCAVPDRCPADSEARALYGRAVCRERLGQRAAAREDVQRYLRRFPRGSRAEALRRASGIAR